MSTHCSFPIEMYSIDTEFGWYRSCPRIPYQKLEDTDFHNHGKIIQLRQDLRNNIQNELCNDCWHAENNGAKSYRQVLKRDYTHKLIASDRVKPKLLEIKFSNLCNLRCIMCNSKCSSLWENEQPLDTNTFGSVRGQHASDAILQYAKDNYDDIEIFQLFGGEPVLHKQFHDIFDIILERGGKKEISFSTNLFYNEKYRVTFENYIERLLDQGHQVFMRISIDGVGEQGEYFRENLNWNRFTENMESLMDRFHDYPNLGRIRCNIALNAANIMYLTDIMKYIYENSYWNVEPHYNYVATPAYLYVMTYGRRLKKAIDVIKTQDFYIYDKYKTHVIDLLESMVHLDPDELEIQRGKRWLKEYDERIGKDFLTIFPRNEFMFDD